MKLPLSPKYVLAVIFFGAVLTYAIYQLSGVTHQPKLNIDSPVNGATVKNELITISGRADGLIRLSLDDEKVTLQANGQFATELLVAEGYNIITLSGADRFGRTVKKKLQLIYVPSS